MYFGYGLPRTLACSLGRDQEPWVALHHDQQFVAAITSSTVQLWSAGLHRVRLSVVDCNTQNTGTNVDALWCSSKPTLAVLTDSGHLNIYLVQLSQEPALPAAAGSNAREPCKATLYLCQSTLIESQTLPTCLAGDSKMVLVGCQDGSIQLFTWQGKVRDVLMPTYLCDDDTPEMQPGFLTRMHYCDRSKLLAVVLSNGSCAVLSAGLSSGSGFIRELEFSHWVCFMGASCVRINAVAQLIAVGTTSGTALLYRLHVPGLQGAPEAVSTQASLAAALGGGLGLGPGGGAEPPVRQLSLEPWGHPLQQTGPVSMVEWAPDGRAIAVAYQYSGVVVWSPSGCRLFSSIRQAPDLARSTSLIRTPPAAATAEASATYFCDPKLQSLAQQGIAEAEAGMLDTATGSILHSKSSQLANSPLQGSIDTGVSVLCWGPGGYLLTVGYSGGSWALEELQFARSLPHHHRVAHASVSLSGAPAGTLSGQAVEELHLLQAHDRLLLVTESAQSRAGSTQPLSHSHGRPGPATDMEGMGLNGSHNRASDLAVTHLTLPYQYIASNWPVSYVTMNPNGIDIAVAGRTGLALYSRALDRWRLFGDVSQERKVACVAVGWIGNIVLACTRVDEQSSHSSRSGPSSGQRGSNTDPALQPHHLLLFPKHHLDFSSLLCRFPLAQAPVAMDCVGRHVLLAFEGMDLALFEVVITGEVKPSSHATATLQLVRDVSMLQVGRPLMGITLVQFKRQMTAVRASSGHMTFEEDGVGTSSKAVESTGNQAALAAPPAPTQCVLHRWGGLLSVLDLERGSEVLLGTNIEAFWISHILQGAAHAPQSSLPAASAPALLQHMKGQLSMTSLPSSAASLEDISGPREVDLPWWGYGPQGMQLWFTSSFLTSHQPTQHSLGSLGSFQLASMPSAEARAASPSHHDLELEFDAEVYPIGISLADAAIIGVVQRTIRGQPGKATAGAIPSFHLVPESQPVLPCLLRRLLLRGALLEARSLALRHSNGPHFSRSLEWLLFTALEADVERPSQQNGSSSLLALAASLLRSFPQLHAECVVAVARKTDISLWPALFKAVGSPSALLDGLVERSSLTAAANMLLVVDSMEGPDIAYGKAVRLLQVTLARAQYSLASELLRFILFPNEDEPSQQDAATPQAAGDGGVRVQQGQISTQASKGLGAQKDSTGGNGAAKAKPSISWFGWLFGYGSNSSDQLQSQNSFGRPLSPRRRAGSLQADQQVSGKPTTPGYPNTPHSASAHSALSHHAAAARRAVSEHAWGLLEQGRLLQLLQLATATTFLPGGLMHLMRQHMLRSAGGMGLHHASSSRALGDTPNASQQPLPLQHKGASSASLQSAGLQSHTSQMPAAVTGLNLLSALSLVVTQLPVWQSSDIEEDARAVLEVVQQLEPYAQVWVLALSILLVDLAPVRLYAAQQPAEWAMVANVVKHDKTFAFLHGVIDMLGESAVDGGDELLTAVPAYSPALPT